MGLADAVDAPRWLLGRTWGQTCDDLEAGEPLRRADSSQALARLATTSRSSAQPYSETCGHAGMLVKHARDGRVEAAHDPRSDGGRRGAVMSFRGFAKRRARNP